MAFAKTEQAPLLPIEKPRKTDACEAFHALKY